MTDNALQLLGGSLPVPNVQDLAARPDGLTAAALDRYVRPQPTTDDLLVDVRAEDLPVIDLGKLLVPGLAGREEAAKLRSACENWGFFQVVNHGIPEEIVEGMKRNIKGFFDLPLGEKLAFAQKPGGAERGQGYGQAFVHSEEQKLDWADMFFIATQPPSYRSLDFWPSKPSTFRSCMETYSAQVQRVAIELLRAMASNLGLQDPKEMTRLAGAQSMKINYYPPCPQAHVDRLVGLSPHSDAVGLTLLLQVSPVAGLQIRRNGGWVPVNPLLGALVANVGDVTEILTNGRYKSIEHRAVVNAREERMSVAAFHSAKFGEMYRPLEELVGGDEVRYRSIRVEDYAKLVLSSKLDGKNIMDGSGWTPEPKLLGSARAR